MGMNQAELRKDYQRSALDPSDVDPDPLEQFRRWYEEQKQVTSGEPNAMTVATATTDGQPSARVVLLKHWDADGFVFFSSYNSPKGVDISENPRAALLFYWPETERQVRIEGNVTPTSRQETEDYFHSRPRGSQIAANIARQSQPVPSRETLELEMAALTDQFEGERFPCRRPGVDSAYRRSESSSGRDGPAACTTACSTPVKPTAGRSCDSHPRGFRQVASGMASIAIRLTLPGVGRRHVRESKPRLLACTVALKLPVQDGQASPVRRDGARITDWTNACSAIADSSFFAFDDLRWHENTRFQLVA